MRRWLRTVIPFPTRLRRRSRHVHAPTQRALATTATKVLTKAPTSTVTERGHHALGSLVPYLRPRIQWHLLSNCNDVP